MSACYLVNDLDQLSKQLSIPILVVTSMDQSKRRGSLFSRLRDSGDLEYSAITALFLVENKRRRVMLPDRAIDLVVAKNRYGETGKIPLVYYANTMTIREKRTS